MDTHIYHFTAWVQETDPAALTEGCTALLAAAGFTVVDRLEHRFAPQGYTALWLLAESHLAVHTFPEATRTYVELSSCNRTANEAFAAAFAARFAVVAPPPPHGP